MLLRGFLVSLSVLSSESLRELWTEDDKFCKYIVPKSIFHLQNWTQKKMWKKSYVVAIRARFDRQIMSRTSTLNCNQDDSTTHRTWHTELRTIGSTASHDSPKSGKSLNGSFFSTSMPSPPPVSFLDTSATLYSWATWYSSTVSGRVTRYSLMSILEGRFLHFFFRDFLRASKLNWEWFFVCVQWSFEVDQFCWRWSTVGKVGNLLNWSTCAQIFSRVNWLEIFFFVEVSLQIEIQLYVQTSRVLEPSINQQEHHRRMISHTTLRHNAWER